MDKFGASCLRIVQFMLVSMRRREGKESIQSGIAYFAVTRLFFRLFFIKRKSSEIVIFHLSLHFTETLNMFSFQTKSYYHVITRCFETKRTTISYAGKSHLVAPFRQDHTVGHTKFHCTFLLHVKIGVHRAIVA